MLLLIDNLHASIFSPYVQHPQEVASHETGSLPRSIRSRIHDEHMWFFGGDDEGKFSLNDSLSHSEESLQVFRSQKEEKTSGERSAISATHLKTKKDKEN